MFKKLALILPIILCFVCHHQFDLSDVAVKYEGTFYFYTYQFFTDSTCKTLSNGHSYIVSTDTKNALNIRNKIGYVTGQSFVFTGNDNDVLTLKEKLKIEIIFEESIENKQFIYGNSPYLKTFVNYNNQKINIQICKEDNTISVGSPLILGSI